MDIFAAIINQAMPGLRVRDSQALGEASHLLTLSDGQRVVLRLGDVANEVLALRLLAGEIDLPAPALIDADLQGAVGGTPWLLRSYQEGTPLPALLNQLDEEARHTVGQQLGEIMARVHNLACGRYGALDEGDPLATRDDLAYLVRRAEAAIVACEASDALPSELAADLRHWFSQEYIATGRAPALVHGDLHPDHILLRLGGRREDGSTRVTISGLVGWSYALAWSPGWDHANFIDGAEHPAFFSVRVGYGERYDESNNRASEQVREYAMQPYRLVRYLELLRDAENDDDRGLYRRHLAALLRLRGKTN